MNGLAGRRILLTREREDCVAWAAELESQGAVPVLFPCIECREFDTPELRERLAAELPRARWLAFTSRRGVAAFVRLRGRAGAQSSRTPPSPPTPSSSPSQSPPPPPSPSPSSVRIAVVGPATARAAAATLGRTDLDGGPGGTAASLGAALAPLLEPRDRVLIAVAENAGRALEAAIASAGAECTRLDVYRTVPSPPAARKAASSALGADNVFLASPSAVTGFVNRVRLDTTPGIFTIGPSTTAAARAAGLEVTGEAARPGLDGLVEAMRCAS